jgi:hypothetical protein
MANKTVTVRPSGGTYTTLAAAIAGEVTANANLTAAGMNGILTISIEGDWSGGADTAAVNVTGFTTNASYYVNIVTDAANKAGTVWSTSKYRYISGGFNITSAYTRVTGLQIGNSLDYRECLKYVGGGIVDSCYIQGYVSGSTKRTVQCEAANSILSNSIVNCKGQRGVNTSFVNSFYIYNCIIINSSLYGISVDSGYTIYVKNCYSGNNADADYYAAGTITYTTDYSEDGTGTTTTATFSTSSGAYFANVTAGSEDLAIGASSALIGVGTDLRADATWPFDYDIIGTTRGATWDVGAFEYVAPAGGLSIPVAMHHYRMLRG